MDNDGTTNTPMDSPVIAARSLTCRSRKTNKPRKMVLDCRSLLGRRVLDLADAFAAALGGWSGLGDMLAANVRRAAELVALAEQARATALRTGTIDFLDVIDCCPAQKHFPIALREFIKRDWANAVPAIRIHAVQ
jgi:hypothetical protein